MRGAFNPIEEIERRIASGDASRDAVDRARALWREQLRDGVILPNGERVMISERDVHHALPDTRILRKPERIERLLSNVFELRSADLGRRLGLSQWVEREEMLYGYAILDPDGHLRTMHVINARGLSKKARQGTLPWRRDESA